jgi:phytoene desaturase
MRTEWQIRSYKPLLRPKLKSKKVKNLYFTGQLTVPGPGVPPSLISGKLVADLIAKYDKN